MWPIRGVVIEWSLQQVLLAMVTLLLLLLLYCVYMLWPVWNVRHIPCPPYWLPGLGHVPILAVEQTECLVRLARKYGPVYRLHFGRHVIVMVADAELCRQLSIKNFKMARDRARPGLVQTMPLMRRTLTFTKGETWSLMRNIELPFYHSDQMRKYIPMISTLADALVERLSTIRDGQDVNISQWLSMLTLDVIGEAAFGAHFRLLQSLEAESANKRTSHQRNHSNEDAELERKLAVASNDFLNAARMDGGGPLSTTIGLLFPFAILPLHKLLSSIPGTADWLWKLQTEAITGVLAKVLKHRKSDVNLGDRIDMLSLLLSSTVLDDDYINALTFEMLLAGSDTTSVTISVCIYLISCHPHVEQKVIHEIDSFGRLPPKLSHDDLRQFPYVEQVLKETLRLHSVVPLTFRCIDADMNLGGYLLKRGTHVSMSMNAVMKDPIQFKDPEVFQPERFDENCDENKQRHPCAFMPFGMGPRACIGSKFAMQEAKIVLIKLYKNFTFTHSPVMEKPLAFNVGLTRRPRYGVRLRVHRRPDKISAQYTAPFSNSLSAAL